MVTSYNKSAEINKFFSAKAENIIQVKFFMNLIQKAVVKNGDKYLIGLRSENAKYFPLHWDFPGGKLEPNEDPFDGIKREVKEETDLDIKPLVILGVYELH